MRHDACSLGDLDGGKLVEVDAGGLKILLSRDGDTINAVGAVCPHKGAPLKNGARVGNKVICPWHHAIFDLATGDHLEPPGKKCLTRFATHIENGRVLVDVPDGADVHRPEVDPSERRTGGSRVFAIVGAGAAGLACAQELVKCGFDGRIVMISPEPEPPYDRTDLSKTYLSGKTPDAKLPLVSREVLAGLGIETLVAEATAVDPNERTIRFADGGSLAFDKCFVAPGSAAAPFAVAGADAANVHTLRSHDDAAALKDAVEKAAHVVVVGSGFIGMEAAAQFAAMNKRVSVISTNALPFAERFGVEVAGQIADQHEAKGVALHVRSQVESLKVHDGRVIGVRLDSGEEIEADLVVAALGAVPRVSIVDASARKGLEVNAMLEWRPGVHLGGDIACVPLPGRPKPLRIEHWRFAEQHGRHAARAMLGRATEPFWGIPFFWTAQFDRVSYLGHADSADDVHVVGDLKNGSYTAFIVERGRVTAAVGRGADDRTPALHALMLSDPAPSRETLETVGWDPAKLVAGSVPRVSP